MSPPRVSGVASLPVGVPLPVQPLDRLHRLGHPPAHPLFLQPDWRLPLGQVGVLVLEQGPQVPTCRMRQDEVGLVGRQEAGVQLRDRCRRRGGQGKLENLELGVERLLLRGRGREQRSAARARHSRPGGRDEMRGKPPLGALLTWRIRKANLRSVVLITHTLVLPVWLSALAVLHSWTLPAWHELESVEIVEKSDSESDSPRSCSRAGSVTSATSRSKSFTRWPTTAISAECD